MTTTTTTTSRRESKDAGRRAYLDKNFAQALFNFLEAIDKLPSSSSSPSPSRAVDQEGSRAPIATSASRSGGQHPFHYEHQILLSNVVACRLKIGGIDMAEKAVEEAKQCISINDKWYKAHIRLASAYIALGNHSNDACLSLQRAISLDRNNKVARSMLVREMRDRNHRERCGGRENGREREGNFESSLSSPSHQHPQQCNEEASNHQTSSKSSPSAPPQQQQQQQQDDDELDIDDIDDDDDNMPSSRHPSLQTIFSQRIQQLISWYHSQSDDFQTLLLVSILFLALYVALGGRFGFDSELMGDSSHRWNVGGIGRTTRGNYGQGNAYERYSTRNRYSSEANNERYDNYDRQQQQEPQQQQPPQTNTGYNDRTNPQNDGYYSSQYEYYIHEPRRGRGQGGTATSYHMPNLNDGSIVSMAILLLLGFACHKFGMNPFQALWMLNLVQRHAGNGGAGVGRFGYGAYRGRGGGGIFMGGGGGGFGFGGRLGRRGRGG